MVIKMKSNAGKHIIANPSLFVLGIGDTKDIEGESVGNCLSGSSNSFF